MTTRFALMTLLAAGLALGCGSSNKAPDETDTSGADATDRTDGTDSTDSTDSTDGTDGTDGTDTAPVCPEAQPAQGQPCTGPPEGCEYGADHCCGESFPATKCTCADGEWSCNSTAACAGLVGCCDLKTLPDCASEMAKAECEAAGGKIAEDGIELEPYCFCPTPDGGCACSSGSECTGKCVFEGTGSCETQAHGTCNAFPLVQGCHCFLNGTGEGEQICGD